jgi:hypothetical protein
MTLPGGEHKRVPRLSAVARSRVAGAASRGTRRRAYSQDADPRFFLQEQHSRERGAATELIAAVVLEPELGPLFVLWQLSLFLPFVEQLRTDYVTYARLQGESWAEIGHEAGMSGQAARARWSVAVADATAGLSGSMSARASGADEDDEGE